MRPRDEPLARPLVPAQARHGQDQGAGTGADRRERDPPLLGPRAVGDAAPRALEPGRALRRARRNALLARRPAPPPRRLEIDPAPQRNETGRWRPSPPRGARW